MKLTILGSSGSLGAPGNPASGYFIEAPDMPGVIMDLGPGTLANLQTLANPSEAHVIFSHLHADHCLDFPSLLVWRRYHPALAAKRRHHLMGPGYAPLHLGRLFSDDQPNGVDDLSDTFAFRPWRDRQAETIDSLSVTPFEVVHPVEAYALRVIGPGGASIAFSGDTAWTRNLIDAARDVDLFLCEANWGTSTDNKAPAMHLSGGEAGRAARLAEAKRLVIVHVPPWLDPEEAVVAARKEFDGPVEFGRPGSVYEV
ncbi:MBL fold metallo-hydrolase [Corynebacterium sp. zg-331]|uniref:MBL fold metallo-hydrolase n=1 Tax=unclassified Corynebacterium TaxID=2624378 RepID=UPI00128E0C82|nr:MULTISPECIES: MBL fold metallo-hydrolase [unclassified Corynebacterium]MBC3184988.1 MBL fold metallo-hydrolase [Corynebacterium sp. zg-331]MPV51490.1 MBL fold metallo-hydrolase [Corynebacterium sp. zg331]